MSQNRCGMRRFDKYRVAPKPDSIITHSETEKKLQELIQMRQQQDQLYSFTQNTVKSDVIKDRSHYKTDHNKRQITIKDRSQ